MVAYRGAHRIFGAGIELRPANEVRTVTSRMDKYLEVAHPPTAAALFFYLVVGRVRRIFRSFFPASAIFVTCVLPIGQIVIAITLN